MSIASESATSSSAAPQSVASDSMDAIFLLPAWSAFGRQALANDIARMLGRADRLPLADPGRRAQRERYIETLPKRWAPAAVSRQRDAGDAAGAAWLRADPAYVRPDINGARLLAYGDALALTQADADALLPALRPIFGDRGFFLDAPTPSRWYLRLPRGGEWPEFSEPDAALGEDMFEHLPQGPAARQWRGLLNEAQIVLHQHEANAARRERGLPIVNALWVWGGGMLPDRVRIAAAQVRSDDRTLRDHAHVAGVVEAALPARFDDAIAGGLAGLYDLSYARDLKAMQHDWLQPAIVALREGRIAALLLDAVDGRCLRLTRGQRLRFWRPAWVPSVEASSE
jgi:hypothetical protein